MQASRHLHQSKCKPFQLCCMWVWRPRSGCVCVCVCVRSFCFLCLWDPPFRLISPCWNPCHALNSISNTCVSIKFVLITTAWCDLFPPGHRLAFQVRGQLATGNPCLLHSTCQLHSPPDPGLKLLFTVLSPLSLSSTPAWFLPCTCPSPVSPGSATEGTEPA